MSRGPTEEVRMYQLKLALKPAAIIEAEAKAEGRAISHVLRRISEDYASMYGLSLSQFEALEADRKELGLDKQGYFKELLDHRYRIVLAGGAGAPGPAVPQLPAAAAGGRKK